VNPQGWTFDHQDLPSPRLIYVTPSCHWPLGAIMRMEERLRLLTLAERYNAWNIEDDYDAEYRFRGRPIPALRGIPHSDRVIYVGTFGKTIFPTLRLGFLVVPPELSTPFNRAMSVTRSIRSRLLAGNGRGFHQTWTFRAPSQANAASLCAASGVFRRTLPEVFDAVAVSSRK
jgi:GntR family transcriptional regulator/MocR family aminotransferase